MMEKVVKTTMKKTTNKMKIIKFLVNNYTLLLNNFDFTSFHYFSNLELTMSFLGARRSFRGAFLLAVLISWYVSQLVELIDGVVTEYPFVHVVEVSFHQ